MNQAGSLSIGLNQGNCSVKYSAWRLVSVRREANAAFRRGLCGLQKKHRRAAIDVRQPTLLPLRDAQGEDLFAFQREVGGDANPCLWRTMFEQGLKHFPVAVRRLDEYLRALG